MDKNFLDDNLKNIAIFGALGKDEINEILDNMQINDFKNGDIIFKEGSSPKFINIVIKGSVELFSKKCMIRKVNTFDVFGEVAMLAIKPYCVTAKAIGDVTLLQMSNLRFHSLSKKNPLLFTRLLLNITREICREHYLLTNEKFK